MAGYTRQSVADIINGADITAPPVNAEFNQIASAFNGATGHSHDGSTGNAPKIDLTTSVSGYLPAVHGGTGGKNNFSATTNPAATDDAGDGYAPGSMWENTSTGRIFICVGNTANAAVWRELVQIETSNVIKPISHNTIDLGTPTVRFQDLYLQGGISSAGNASLGGTLNVTGATTLTGAATANGGLTVNGTTSLAGSVTIGDPLSSLDTISVGAGFTSNLVPSTNAGASLGVQGTQWNNLYIDGTATIDTLTVDENATVAGTLGVTGTSTLSTANITNITATGTINLAGATVSNLGTVTTAAIGGGSLNNVVIGGSTPAAITGTTITGTSLVGPLTGNVTGNVTGNLTGSVTGNVTGNLTGNVTATSGTSNFTNVTISGQLNMDATSAATITNLSAPVSDNDAARKIDVDNAVANLVDSAPGTLDTLNELAAALGDDPDFATTITNSIATKLPKSGGTMSGAINMGGQKITNAADPTAAQDLATKNYIDTTYVDYSSAGDAATDARKLATNAEDVQYTLADGSTTGYSALHYAAKAAASYDSFDDRYLGSKASDPTLDNDNNALITGALYFDSTNGVMKVYNGTEWANASSSIEGIKSNFYYTATSGQTAFSGADDNSNTLVIDKAGLVNVYMNGVRLHEDDYTVSAAADSVTLAAGAATGDLIYLEVFGNFAGQSGADVAITGGSIVGLTELGIGTNSPSLPLEVYHASNSRIVASTSSTGASQFCFGDDADDYVGRIYYDHNGNTMRFHANTSERMRIDSSGRVGIGTISPARTLEVYSSQPAIKLNNGTNAFTIGTGGFVDGSNSLVFFDEGVGERMRIDSSGNLLVGKTSASSSTAGFQASQDGQTAINRSGVALQVGRLSSDGNIVEFRKDGSTVGSIASQNSTDLVINSTDDTFLNAGGATGLALYQSGGSIESVRLYSGGSEAMRINSSGQIGIGTSTLNSNQVVIEGGNAGTHSSNLKLSTGNSANGLVSNLAFTGTFVTPTTDKGPRRTADITSGYITANWGNEYLAFGVGGATDAAYQTTTRMLIDGSGQVGIGTTSPLTKAHIQKSDVSFTPDANADILIVENNGTSAIQIVASATDKSELFFSDTTRNRGGFSYNHSSDYLAFLSNGSERMRIDSGGNLLVGKTVTTEHVNGCRFLAGANGSAFIASDNDALVIYTDTATANTGGAKGHILFKRGTNNALVGSITSTTTSTVYNTSSDHRLKENVVELTGATTRLKQLEPKRFNFIADADTTVDGFIAHEVQSIVPEAITGTHNEVDADGNPVYQGIDQSKLVPLLVATIKELEARITALEAN